MMNIQTIVDTEFVTLWYYPEEGIIHHQIHKYLYGSALRDALTAGGRLVEAHGAQKWLSDDRKNSALHPEDSRWTQTVWFPRVARAGWKYWAMVLPAKVTGQMYMKRAVEGVTAQGVTTEMFDEPEVALRWLRRQPLVAGNTAG
jgi:hypothetical protein